MRVIHLIILTIWVARPSLAFPESLNQTKALPNTQLEINGYFGFGFDYSSVLNRGNIFFNPAMEAGLDVSVNTAIKSIFEAHTGQTDYEVLLKEIFVIQQLSNHWFEAEWIFGRSKKGFDPGFFGTSPSRLLNDTLIEYLNLLHFYGTETQLTLKNKGDTSSNFSYIVSIGAPESKHNNINLGIGYSRSIYSLHLKAIYQQQRIGDETFPVHAFSVDQSVQIDIGKLQLYIVIGEDPNESALKELLRETATNNQQFSGIQFGFESIDFQISEKKQLSCHIQLSELLYPESYFRYSAKDIILGVQLLDRENTRYSIGSRRQILNISGKDQPTKDELVFRLDYLY